MFIAWVPTILIRIMEGSLLLMNKKVMTSMLIASTVLLMSGCSKKDSTLSNIPTEKKIEKNGSVLDVLVADYTSKKTLTTLLSKNGITYIEDEDCIRSDGVTCFLDYDSTFEIYYNDDDESIFEAYSYLYFRDEDEFMNAKDTVSNYLSRKTKEEDGLSISTDAETGTIFFPITMFETEEGKQVLYLTLSETSYDELPSSGYISEGYEITEETALYDDWQFITSEYSEADENDE